MGDVDEHALGSNLLAAHFLFQRVVKSLCTCTERARALDLALAFAGEL